MSRPPGTRTHATRPERGTARPVARPHDRHEREAERAADIVARGGSVSSFCFSALAPSAPAVHRQDGGKPTSDDEKKKAALKAAGEAFLESKPGKELKDKVLSDPDVKRIKDAVTSPAGIAVTGALAAGGVAALGATHQPLPFQPPQIPLDRITPGLSAQVKYEGPVDRPTFVGLTLSYKEQGPKKKDEKRDQIAADVARLKAQQDMFKPASQKAAEQREADDFVQAYVRSQKFPAVTVPLTGAKEAEDVPKADQEEKKPDEQKGVVQKAPATAGPEGAAPAEAYVDDALASPGRPLDPSTRRAMEARFGYDFSAVRIHDDAAAAATAADIDAAAFTVGQDVVFGGGRFDPSGAEGWRLLAHELAHVAQHQDGRRRLQRKAEPAISDPGDASEREADEVGDRVAAGLSVTGAGVTSPRAALQRQEADEATAPDDDLIWPEMGGAAGPELQASRASGPAVAPPGFTRGLAATGGGVVLPARPARRLGRAFGTSFGAVRLHRDAVSDRLASMIGAEAFVAGGHIYLAGSAPDPESPAGLRLLAHELTHVRQQAAAGQRAHLVQPSRALYFSTHGDPGYFSYARRYHADRGFPAPVNVSSVEELIENLVQLPRPIESVRLITHALPVGIFLPLLRGGASSLFQSDLVLQSQERLESELATEHTTERQRRGDDPGAFAVREHGHHVVPRDWITDAYARVRATIDGEPFLRTRQFPPSVIAGGDLETLIWWILDRELVLAERPLPARRGQRARTGHVVTGLSNADRTREAASLERNAAIYRERARDHLLLRGFPAGGTPEERRVKAAAAVTEFDRRVVAVAGPLIDARMAQGIGGVSFGLPSQRYGTLQGALERDTFSNNVLRAKVAIQNGMPLEIRGCRIGQNASWLESFRDFWGLGADSTRRRPDVSAPDLFDIYGLVRGRSAEWLSTTHTRGRVIHEGTPEFARHIVHRR